MKVGDPQPRSQGSFLPALRSERERERRVSLSLSRSVGRVGENPGNEVGGPQVGEVTCGGSPHLTCKRDHIKMSDYMDRWVTPPNQITSPTWGPHLHVNRPLKLTLNRIFKSNENASDA